MKIVLACHAISSLGGSELYNYELSRTLKELGHEVHLLSGHPIAKKPWPMTGRLLEAGVQLHELKSQPELPECDIMLCSQPEITQYMCTKYPEVPKIQIVHSCLRSDGVIKHDSIKHYITVDHPTHRWTLPQVGVQMCTMIWNPIDAERFNTKCTGSFAKTTGIFQGSFHDDLRRPILNHIIKSCIERDWDLIVMNGGYDGFPTFHPNIKYVSPMFNTEHLLKNCDFTVGHGGRTTIEGWMCGKPGLVYKMVNPTNWTIQSIKEVPVPKVDRFNRFNVANNILEVCKICQ